MEYKIPISVLVIIYTPALEVLLLERADFPGFWQCVTGSRHGDESLRETAIREVYEETGISDSDPRDWEITNRYEIFAQWRHRYPPGTTHNVEHVFGLPLIERVPVRLSTREHQQYEWLHWQEAAAKVFSWSNREALLALPRYARAQG